MISLSRARAHTTCTHFTLFGSSLSKHLSFTSHLFVLHAGPTSPPPNLAHAAQGRGKDNANRPVIPTPGRNQGRGSRKGLLRSFWIEKGINDLVQWWFTPRLNTFLLSFQDFFSCTLSITCTRAGGGGAECVKTWLFLRRWRTFLVGCVLAASCRFVRWLRKAHTRRVNGSSEERLARMFCKSNEYLVSEINISRIERKAGCKVFFLKTNP